MKYPICLQWAQENLARGDYREYICSGCGSFRVTNQLTTAQGSKGFDVPAARARLEQLRTDTEVPTLRSSDVYVLLQR